jgi:hypothetical protein
MGPLSLWHVADGRKGLCMWSIAADISDKLSQTAKNRVVFHQGCTDEVHIMFL